MLTLFLEMTRNVLFLSSSLWPLPDLKKWKKFLHWQGFHSVESTHKFLVTLHIVVGPQLFATTVVVKQMAIALKNLVILIVGKDVKFFSHYNVKLFFLSFVLHQILAAVKPQVTVLAEKMSSSTCLLLSRDSINSPTNMPSTPAGPVVII